MAKHGVCPWWIGYFLISPLRKWMQDPAQILAPYIRAGMTVLEPGPGMGFFTLEIARLVGPAGRVVAVDVQPRMIDGLKRRARNAGLFERIDARLAQPGSMGLEDIHETVDFVLAFAMVHETPSAANFFAEARRAMKPGATLLLAEPAGHVGEKEFADELAASADNGLKLIARPTFNRCMAALLEKSRHAS
jgi:SAM-dependent methyltransferase